MRPTSSGQRIVFKIVATLFALPHLINGWVALPFIILCGYVKLMGQRGNPFSFSGHGRLMSELEAWSWLMIAGTVATLAALYGLLLFAGLWTPWEKSQRVRHLIRLLAGAWSVGSVPIWMWLVFTSSEPERREFLILGMPVVQLYIAFNRAVIRHFS